MIQDTASRLRQSCLDEAQGDVRLAYDIAVERWAAAEVECDALIREHAKTEKLRSWAYARELAPKPGKPDDVPNPITDEWIHTGRSGDAQ